jgi:2-methylisocitrate lyase-like PEP mutase family enzyme
MAGARAIATTSLGIANSLGLSDGEAYLPSEESLRIVRHMTRAVTVPVTADIEAGYGNVEAMVEAVIEAGAVGINLEDRVGNETSPRPIGEAANRVAAAREAAERAGVPLFINARTDTLILGGDVADAVERLRAYVDAGAECVLPIGANDPATISAIAESVRAPLNVNADPNGPSIGELAELGVRRVSVTLYRAMTSFIKAAAEQLLTDGRFSLIAEQQPFPDLNGIFRAMQDQVSG